MIRKTLANTKAATFSADLCRHPQAHLPQPTGTGFFVSPDGFFVTARHVLTEDGNPKGKLRAFGSTSVLMQPDSLQPYPVRLNIYFHFDLVEHDPDYDFALLKVDITQTSPWITRHDRVPFLEISLRVLEEGDPVYSFGYPLSPSVIIPTGPNSFSGGTKYSPRTTSAIVSSSAEFLTVGAPEPDCRHYVLDKALNYGNSGGPIVSTETGKVHAFCSRFQPVVIPQPHLGTGVAIQIPSLYGIVTSLASPGIVALLQKHGIPLARD
jgi:S1-C subfamily serine protease